MGLWNLLERAAARHSEKTAIVAGGLRRTYADFARRSKLLASWFNSRGLQLGDRVSILELNTARYLEAYFAAASAGLILNPLNFRQSASELAFTVSDAESRWLLASPEFSSLVAEICQKGVPLDGVLWLDVRRGSDLNLASVAYEAALEDASPRFEPVAIPEDSVAHLYYTSGTTGRPKGVMLTHQNVGVHAANAVCELSLTERDIWGHFAPLFHLADAWAVFAITQCGGTHVMLPRFDEDAALRLLESERVTLTNLVPMMLNLMVKCPRAGTSRFPDLRLILSGGAPISPGLVQRIMEVLRCDYVQTYGMTETSPYLTLGLLPSHLKALPQTEQLAWKAKTGRPFRGVELKVVRTDGTEVDNDGREIGEIWVRGPTVTPGYWNRPEETAAAFEGGWLKTGDLAVRDAEGFVNIVDRKKDVIISGGEKVYSPEVERVLCDHPAVLESAVFGRPDEVWGETVSAAVVLCPGAQAPASELIAWCRARLSGYKVPRSIEFLPELPKTGSGKVSKRSLRERILPS